MQLPLLFPGVFAQLPLFLLPSVAYAGRHGNRNVQLPGDQARD